MRVLRHLLAVAVMISCFGLPASAQRTGEYLSEEEQDAVRLAQEIEPRAKIFVKLAERRLMALTGTPQPEKEAEQYGPLPTGSQADLLHEYRRVLDEFMDKIDDIYERQGSSKSMGKAMKLTLEGLEAQLKTLAAYKAQLKGEQALHYHQRAVETVNVLLDGIRPLVDQNK